MRSRLDKGIKDLPCIAARFDSVPALYMVKAGDNSTREANWAAMRTIH